MEFNKNMDFFFVFHTFSLTNQWFSNKLDKDEQKWRNHLGEAGI